MVKETKHLQILVIISWSSVVHLRLVPAFHLMTHFSSMCSCTFCQMVEAYVQEQKWTNLKKAQVWISLVVVLTRLAMKQNGHDPHLSPSFLQAGRED